MMKLNKKLVALFATAVAFAGFTAASSAALIDPSSEIGIFGTFTPGNDEPPFPTILNFPEPATIAAGVNDFAFAVGGSAIFNTLTPGTTGTIFTFAGGGAFSADSVGVDFVSETGLGITYLGTWSLDGFDSTPGQLVLTFDLLGGLGTFSASGTVQPIPVPAAVWLFGSALAGLSLIRRRKSS